MESVIIMINKKIKLSPIQSRDFCNNLLNQIPAMIWKINNNLQCEYVNMAWEQFTGLKIKDALGNGLIKVIHPDDLEVYKQAIIESNSRRESFEIEVRLRRDDGEYRCCLVTGTPYYDLEGRYDGYIGTNVDITESKKEIERLNPYQHLAEITDDIILFIDMDGRIINANQAAINAYGYSYEELCSINIKDIREDWGYTKKQMEIANKTGIFFEALHRRKDGSCFDVEVSSRGIDMDNKRILVSIVRDISKRKAAQQKLKEQEMLFRTVFEKSPIGMAFCKSNGEIIDVNPMYEKIFGRSKNELKRLGWHNITHPEDLYNDMDNFNKYVTGQLNYYEINKRYVKSDGSVVWGCLTLTPLLTDNTKQISLAMVEDITERIQAEQALRKSESKHRAMIDNISDVIAIIDENTYVKYISPNIKKILGWEIADVLNTSIWNRAHPDDKERIQQMLSTLLKKDNSERTVEFKYRCKDGNYKIVELTAKNLMNDIDIKGILMNYRDITARRERDDKIRYLYYHDVLTGLYNRISFEKEKKMLDKEKNLPLSIILGDINGLKLINNALGQDQGDKLIVSVAKVIKNCIRKRDFLARTGGDEFCILLPNTSNDEAHIIMKLIEEEYAKYKLKAIYHTSISLACATKISISEAFSKIVQAAEDNMYRNKLLQNKSVHSSIVAFIKTTLFEKNQETEEHAARLNKLSKAIGQRMNLMHEQLNELELLATLHDIGKIGISDVILNKPGKLTEEERVIMNKHPEIGYRIAMSTPELAPIADYILYHHERYDGKGYPEGLKGDKIPLLSRIISVVDSYDVMTSGRSYQNAMTKEAAINEIRQNAGTQFDPEIAKIFIDIVSEE